MYPISFLPVDGAGNAPNAEILPEIVGSYFIGNALVLLIFPATEADLVKVRGFLPSFHYPKPNEFCFSRKF